MKPTLLFITSMALSSIAHGQHLTDQGNNWFLWTVNWDLNTGYQFQIKIDGDTLINAQTYSTLIRNDNIDNPLWYRLNYYLRENAEKIVYILDSTGHEGILYHFGLEPGQEVELWNGITARVQSIDSVRVANGQMQARFKIYAMRIGPGVDCGTSIEWIDGIGNLGPLPFNYCPDFDISYSIGCFFRDETSLYYPAESNWCEGFVTATEQIRKAAIEVFPNPVTDMLFIQFADEPNLSRNIQLYSPQGQLLYQKVTRDQSHQIDMSPLTEGIFILQVISGEHDLIVKKIVKQ